ncbi:MAG: MoaD/ThiS family protein [Bacillota bacterium]
MKIKVIYPYQKELEIEQAMTLRELLNFLDISYDEVLVLKNNAGIVNDLDFVLGKDDFIQVLPILSGG